MIQHLTRLFAMAHKETLHITRDSQVLYMALIMPLVLVLLFGYAVSFDIEHVAVAVIDQDHSPASRRFTMRLETSDMFEVVRTLRSPKGVAKLFERDELKAAFFIPSGYARSIARGETAKIQVLIDGADGTSARVIAAYSAALGGVTTQSEGAFLGGGLSARIRTWFNPRMESARFVVPGLVGLILAILAVLLSALTVAREWERGSMEQLFATPVDRLSVVLGKVLPYIFLGLLQFLLVLTLGVWLFDTPIEGSLLLLLFSVSLFMACVLGQGLLISMVTKNQQVATQIGAVTAILPSLLLSGFLFPIENMPAPLQLIANIVPARYMIECLRGILLAGLGPADLWRELLALAVLATLLIVLNMLRFKRRLD